MIRLLFLSLPFCISASPSLSLCMSLGLKLEKQGLLFQWGVGLLIGDSGFELFTVKLPGARFLGCRVVSIQAPKPLRINEAPGSASNGTRTSRDVEKGVWPAWGRQQRGFRSGCRGLGPGAQRALLWLLSTKPYASCACLISFWGEIGGAVTQLLTRLFPPTPCAHCHSVWGFGDVTVFVPCCFAS